MDRTLLPLLLTLGALTLGAWVITFRLSRGTEMSMGIVVRREDVPDDTMTSMPGMDMAAGMGMSGMSAAGWTWDGFVAFAAAWTVMMAAMMFPAAAPMLMLYRTVAMQRQGCRHGLAQTWVFAGGYLLVWAMAGMGTWVVVQLGTDLAGRLGADDRRTWAPLALGGVLVAAGLYQITPLKHLCLEHCRSLLSFMTHHWRQGPVGALRMGLHHGAYCLGCCWMLFAVLVGAEVMSLAWMLLLTLIVFAEKVLPIGRLTTTWSGVALLGMGVIVAIGVMPFPWLA